MRVKYRDMKSESGQKIKVRVENLGVHRNNRSGVYPAGIRCKELCSEVIANGFLKEEFSDKIVAVEEMPTHEVQADPSRGEVQTGSQYNRAASSKDELLQTCFREPYGNVQYDLLHFFMNDFRLNLRYNLQFCIIDCIALNTAMRCTTIFITYLYGYVHCIQL